MHLDADLLPHPLLGVMLVLRHHILPHHVQDGSTDQAVFNSAGEEKGSGTLEQGTHHMNIWLASYSVTVFIPMCRSCFSGCKMQLVYLHTSKFGLGQSRPPGRQ